MTAAELVKSLDRHFTVGCHTLAATQLQEHKASGVCRECSERAQHHLHQQLDVQLEQEISRLRPLALGKSGIEGEQ